MRSSTSSSSECPNLKHPIKALVLGIAVAALALGAWEAYWRSKGFRPSLRDSPELWATLRKRASTEGKDAVVLLGASRIQVGFDTTVFRDKTGVSPIQLAIGSSGVPVLEDLADDDRFCGTVIFSWNAGMARGGGTDRPREYIQASRGLTVSDELEWKLALYVQNGLALASPSLSTGAIARAIAKGQAPSPPYIIMRADRSRPADYSLLDIAAHREVRVSRVKKRYALARPLTPKEFRRHVRELKSMVDRIRERGGQVIFVRFPTTGEHWELDEQYFPRRDYWDVLCAGVNARTVHFKDYSALAEINCPDTSHIDRRDAPAFTASLVRILADVLPKP